MEVSQQRRDLERERSATIARIDAASADLAAIMSSSLDSNADDEHDPEGATIAFERAQVAATLEEARVELGELDLALERLEARTYGVCAGCGGDIALARLAALPTARSCIACASVDATALSGLTRRVRGSRTVPQARRKVR